MSYEDETDSAPVSMFKDIEKIEYWCSTEDGRRQFPRLDKIKVELQQKNLVLHCGIKEQRKSIKWYKMYYSLLHLYRYCVDAEMTLFAFAFMQPPTIMSQCEEKSPNDAVNGKKQMKFIIDQDAPRGLQVCL